MASDKILPTSDLGFRKSFSTKGKEHILQGYLQDVFDADDFGIKITDVNVGNPYNIIDVNKLSDNERKTLLLKTELDIHCTVDEKLEIAIEMQLGRDKYIEERIFHNSVLKYAANYDRILATNKSVEKNCKKNSKYSSLTPIVSLNILGYHHFNKSTKALHFFRLYDVFDQKYPKHPNRYTEIYFELKKDGTELSPNLKAWRHFMLTGNALPDSPSYIKEASEMIAISNLSTEEYRLHRIIEKNQQKILSREEYVYDKGFDQGFGQGVEDNKIETAKRLLAAGMSAIDIAKWTDLDLEIVQRIA